MIIDKINKIAHSIDSLKICKEAIVYAAFVESKNGPRLRVAGTFQYFQTEGDFMKQPSGAPPKTSFRYFPPAEHIPFDWIKKRKSEMAELEALRARVQYSREARARTKKLATEGVDFFLGQIQEDQSDKAREWIATAIIAYLGFVMFRFDDVSACLTEKVYGKQPIPKRVQEQLSRLRDRQSHYLRMRDGIPRPQH